jgi:hypothetical protein
MLAYVFWHWPRQDVAAREYEADLAAFHRSLAAHAPPGFRRSLAFRVAALPWDAPQAAGYEDWYLVEDFAALDALNAAAVAGHNRPPHDRAARAAAGGAGGLYRFQNGALDLAEARRATWLSKPAGVGYAEFDAQLRARTAGTPIAVWQRQMTLGPAPEFCLFSRETPPLPEDDAALSGARQVVAGARVATGDEDLAGEGRGE